MRLFILSHDGPVTALTFSSDGELLATGGAEKLAVVWGVSSGERLCTFQQVSLSSTF